MRDIWLFSDPHFSHAGSLKWHRLNNPALPFQRPFSSVEEMNETIVTRWNEIVKPQDKAYILGDVAMKKSGVEWAAKLNGHLRLVRGNHDTEDTSFYLEFFDDVYGVRVFEDLVLSHIPLHPESVKQRWVGNVHGHVHANVESGHFGPRYLNVSAEVIDFRPIHIDEVRFRLKQQQQNIDALDAFTERLAKTLAEELRKLL